ncbi:MAG: hypothetical protein A2836_03435 [Candidatus Taylorbacteria bacterium RIFCSPHIGHO2_01_FULL_45_63]|uniref:Nudix hydrolase domain-containing protein n=1 Tax=Candidatus Taylorbacteria bacterium RIFCSPHIGHO2_02_FULL_45_35 TaxID=1802311 RepID=A0A1G2MRX9_9BACT|nr:MAG: hypothetical protein A2836_03435 [Candidatus Taylorbacteria bacterium RIFCSPHIGHO2_01_FULL_45_63]OHA25761.1 MAG: hypothetical protein A3D56_02400 [Candidatus Taylorbacteria bacterium RIFCSPHIGHO2_02_FULL_45_35]OHA34109.1 MAG: hypothetical protein A3A22_02485 [Candidatus Taylorbacteria bacterium RIFCSPLOWO2_01_FULL_45_34b]
MEDPKADISSAYVFLRKNPLVSQEIVLLRRPKLGRKSGMYTVPGRKIKRGELPRSAAIRAAYEQVGISVPLYKVKPVHVSYRPTYGETGAQTDYFFEVNEWLGIVINREPEECDKIIFSNAGMLLLKNMVFSVVGNAIWCWRNDIFYSELDLNWIRRQGFL